jgi:hypothetical protein
MAALLKHEPPEIIETIYRSAYAAKHGQARQGSAATEVHSISASEQTPAAEPTKTSDPLERKRRADRERMRAKRANKEQLDLFPVALATSRDTAATCSATEAPSRARSSSSFLESKKEEGGGGGTRASPDGISISEEAWAWTRELAIISKIDLDEFWPPGWAGAPMRVQGWINAGWPHDAAMAAARGAMARKIDGPPDTVQYFERPIARMLLKLSAPLPKIIDLESTYARAAKTPRGNRNTEVFAGIRADLAAKHSA